MRSDFIGMENNGGLLWYWYHSSYCASKVKNIIYNVTFKELRRNRTYSVLSFKNISFYFL